MKKFLVFITLFVAVCTGSLAQTARQILDRTAATMSGKGGVRANFSMSGKFGNASGTIAVKGNKFNASTPASIVWYDGKTQWTYMKKSQEVNVSRPTEAQQQAVNPYRFIYMYKSGYTLSSKPAAGGWQVHLVAQNKSRSIKEMYLLVGKNYQLRQVKMRQANGWTTINVSNLRSASLKDSQFRFNSKEYPNAEIIDLR